MLFPPPLENTVLSINPFFSNSSKPLLTDFSEFFDNLRTLIIEGISVLDNMNLNDVSEIKAYLKNLNKKNIKDEAKSFAKKVNFENL